MGRTGVSVAWRLAQSQYGSPAWVANAIGLVAVTAFVLLTLGYAAKLVTAPTAVLAEFRNPIAGNLFGTERIRLLLPRTLAGLLRGELRTLSA